MISQGAILFGQKQRLFALLAFRSPRTRPIQKEYKKRKSSANSTSLGEEKDELAEINVTEGEGKRIEQREGQIDIRIPLANMRVIEQNEGDKIAGEDRFLEIEGAGIFAVLEERSREGDRPDDQTGNHVLKEIILIAFEIEFSLLHPVFPADDIAIDRNPKRIDDREDRRGELFAEQKVGSPIWPSWPIPDLDADLIEVGQEQISDRENRE